MEDMVEAWGSCLCKPDWVEIKILYPCSMNNQVARELVGRKVCMAYWSVQEMVDFVQLWN